MRLSIYLYYVFIACETDCGECQINTQTQFEECMMCKHGFVRSRDDITCDGELEICVTTTHRNLCILVLRNEIVKHLY